MKGKSLVMLVAIALIATGAHAATHKEFTGSVSSAWSVDGNWDTAGVPTVLNQAYVGTAGNASVSAEIVTSGTAYYVRVGGDGEGSLTIKAGATLDITGSIYSGTDDDEWHALDVAVDADGSLTLEAGASINAAADIGLGKGPIWYGGGNLSVSLGANASINTGGGWVQFGLGDDSANGISQEITLAGGASIAAGGGVWFCIGGTVNVSGTVWLNNMRWRGYSADGAATLVLTGDARVESNGVQFQNGGVIIDPTGLTLAPDTWKAVLVDVDGGYWGTGARQTYLTPAAIAAGWQIKQVVGAPFTNQPHSVQVLIPEPASALVLLVGLASLVRRRMRR